MSAFSRRFSACLLLVATMGGFVRAEGPRFTPIQTLTVTQLNAALNANSREHFGHETLELRIDPDFIKTDENGKILSMKVPQISIGHLANDESANAIEMLNASSADGSRWWGVENPKSKAAEVGRTSKWRWESGVQIRLPAQFKRD